MSLGNHSNYCMIGKESSFPQCNVDMRGHAIDRNVSESKYHGIHHIIYWGASLVFATIETNQCQ